jgi:Transglutaminase-like superfamily
MLRLFPKWFAFSLSTIVSVGGVKLLAQDSSAAKSQNKTKPAAAVKELDPACQLSYVAPKTIELLIGLNIAAVDGNLLDTKAQTVFPCTWPEQKVEIIERNVPDNVRIDFRDLPGNNKQLLLFVPVASPFQPVEATLKVRIEKSHIVGPADTSKLYIPKKFESSMRIYLGNSPYIEADAGELKKILKELNETEALTDWNKVERIYDWVRDNIKYETGKLKTVRQALKDRKGDCEEMTSTFVAMCRASRIPARCVWIPNHCYPEFYLEDENGNGQWFPCQVAGTRNFGSMPEYLPILQKGDRFNVPEHKESMRYVQDYLKSAKNLGRTDPKITFIRQLLGDAANLRSPDLNGAANPSSSTETESDKSTK